MLLPHMYPLPHTHSFPSHTLSLLSLTLHPLPHTHSFPSYSPSSHTLTPFPHTHPLATHSPIHPPTLTAVFIILEDGGCEEDYAVVVENKEEPNQPEQSGGLPHSILEEEHEEVLVPLQKMYKQ